MTEHDEAMDRLRISDPAKGSHPDLHSLRALVAQKAPASQGSDEVTRLHHDPLRAPRAVGPWIAAAAVAAIGMGGGGYALGAQQAEPTTQVAVGPASSGQEGADSGRDGAGDGAEDKVGDVPVDVDPPEGEAADGAGADGEPGLIPGGADMAMGGEDAMAEEYTDDMGMAYDPGPVRLVPGEGLPTGPGTGEVRALTSDQDPQELVDRLVDALGMDPRPIPEDDEWNPYAHGAVDPGSGEVVQAGVDGGPLSFHYESMFIGEWCSSMFEGLEEQDLEIIREDWARSYGPDMPLPGPESCRTPEGPAPSEEEAKSIAAEFFATAGIDTTGYTVEVYADDTQSSVNLEYWPEGMEYGQLNLSAVVGPEGVTSAYGNVGEFTSLGDYPVITAAEAVERFGTREWGMDHYVSISEDYAPYLEGETSMPVYDVPEPVTLAPGDRIPVLMKDKTVTGAELVQGSLHTHTGGTIEVPVWKLLTADGMHYSVLALAEEALDYQSWE
ncbi:hypothetical protein [Ornithinimicrobium sufpigmenti]|uniref:hypothetical protein n=1 Tax=Ornithinimicrobium sufpigmenti TaxID=2508882 RepID=UPI001036DA5D|nr:MULTISPECIES: hypothetical protein [unclassified Ornithinimicrobium]